MLDKKVLYALLGGVAIVGAAIAYNSLKGQSEGVEDQIEQELEKMGPIDREDATGMVKFDQFLKILQICTAFGKSQFKETKQKLIKERRQALENNDHKLYEKIVLQMTQDEEMIVQDKLMDIISRLDISFQEFQANTMYHGRDQEKGMQIMQMQQQAQGLGQNEEPDKNYLLSRAKCFEYFAIQQKISIDNMSEMFQSQSMAMNQGQEG